MTTTPALRDIHLAELINALVRAEQTFAVIIDEGPEKSEPYAIEDAFRAIANIMDFLDDLRLGGGAR